MTHLTLALVYCASAAISFGVLAADTSAVAGSAPARMLKSDYRMAKDRLEAEYRAAKEACEGKRRAAERVCLRDAEASHEGAEKSLRADFYGDRRK